MTIDIRLAGVADAALVHRLTQAAFDEYRGQLEPPSSAHDESEAIVAAALAKGGAVVAWGAGEPIGAARYLRAADHLYVGRVAVLRHWRGRGVAAALMLALEQQARTLGLSRIELQVRESLPSNVALYRKLGYAVIERQPHPRNADFVSLRMRKEIGAK